MFKKLFIKNDYVMEYNNLLPACRNGSLVNKCNNIAMVSSIFFIPFVYCKVKTT